MPKNGRPNVKGGNHLIPYSSTKEKLLQELASTEEGGLTEDRVRERLEKYGPNKLREKKKKTKLQRFADQFKDVMILILIAAAIISFVVACTEGNPKEFFCPLLGRCLTFQAAGNILQTCRRALNRNCEVSSVTL